MYLTERFITASAIFFAVFLIGTAINTRSMLVKAAVEPICPTGTTLQNGLCVDGSACPQDFTFKNGKCEKSTPPTCPADYTGPDAQGQCTKTTKTYACPPNTTFEAGECKTKRATPATCPSGSPDSSGQCTTTTTAPAKCPSMDSIPDSQGQCTTITSTIACPSGTFLNGDLAHGGFYCETVDNRIYPSCSPPGGLSSIGERSICGYVPYPNEGVCPEGGTYDASIGGWCITGQPICPSPTSLVYGRGCVTQTLIACPAPGQFFYTTAMGNDPRGECRTTTTTSATCPQGYTLQGAQCVSTTRTNACPLDTTYQNGECIKITTTSATCPSGTTGPDSQGQCSTITTTTVTCPQDASFVNGNCVTVTQINCPTDTAPDDTGTCVSEPTCAAGPDVASTTQTARVVKTAAAAGPGGFDPKKSCTTCPITGKQICNGRQMMKELMDSLKDVPPSQRLSYFEQQLAEIMKLDPSFQGFESTAFDGNKMWSGGNGDTLVFDADTGAVYKGKLQNPQQFVPQQGGQYQPQYDKLPVIAPGT